MSRTALARRLTTVVIGAAMLLSVVCVAGQTTAPATAPAAPSSNEGWVSGSVLDLDGKPVPNFPLKAERNDPVGMGGGGPRNPRPKIVNTTTDDKGNFIFRDLDPGKLYAIVGGNKDIGWAYEEVEIQPGKEIKLAPTKMVKLPEFKPED